MYRISPLWPKYVGERRTTLAKAYGIKVRCYWELFGGNMSGTWELFAFLGYFFLSPHWLNKITFFSFYPEMGKDKPWTLKENCIGCKIRCSSCCSASALKSSLSSSLYFLFLKMLQVFPAANGTEIGQRGSYSPLGLSHAAALLVMNSQMIRVLIS
jgi:hypothetical protein